MSEQKIPDFDENELNAARAPLQTRYRKAVQPQQAEVELDATATGDLTGYPAVFRPKLGAGFAVLKLAPAAHVPLFCYQPDPRFGTGHERYDDLDHCVANLLRIPADHQKELAPDPARRPKTLN